MYERERLRRGDDAERASLSETPRPLQSTKPRRAAVARKPLVVGPANDALEREADRIAADVVRAVRTPTAAGGERRPTSSSTRIRRHATFAARGAATTPAADRIRRSSWMGAEGGALDAASERTLHDARRGGTPIEPALRGRLGDAMGADFSHVRLHTDARADALNRSLNSRAFTTGSHIFFRQGELGSGERSQELLAHELTHVVQQGGSTGSVIERKFVAKSRGTGPEAFNVIENRAQGTPHMDQGIASQPRNYRAPGFNVVVKNEKNQFTAKIVATNKAKAGDNDAVYLAKGLHYSGYLWAKDDNLYGGASAPTRCVKPANADRGDDQHVLFNVTSGVAAGSKAAEQQHIDDYHLAYNLTLGAAEGAIKAVAKRRFKAGKSAQAQGAANQALLGELQARSNGHLSSLIGTDWEAKYDDRFRRSGERDKAGTHLQTVVESTKVANGWPFPVKVVDVQPSATFNLGVSSAAVVDPTPIVQNPQQVADDDTTAEDEHEGDEREVV